MYEIKVGNGNNNIFYITEEEKLRVLRNRMEAERKANRKTKAFVTMLRETALQKVIAVTLAIISYLGSLYTQESGIFVAVSLFCLLIFLYKRNIFEKVEAEEWEDN